MFKNFLSGALVAVVATWSQVAVAQDYPSDTVSIVVPFGPGGGTDFIARAFADKFAQNLGGTVVVDNRAGAGTTVGTAYVANSAPDGHTILMNGSTLTFHPALFKSLPYDLESDIKPIAFVSEQPYVLLVNNDFPADTLDEFVDLAKASPGTIPYASAGVGSAMHLSAELLWRELGVEMLHIPYPGTGAAMNDLLAGEVKAIYTTATGAAEMLNAGTVKALGISSAERSDALPDLPTIAELSLPNYSHTSWIALFVPAATPDDVVAKISEATLKTLDDPQLQEQFATQGLSVRRGTPAEAQAFFLSEIERWTEIIRAAGVEAQ
ncbi:tripartite tricarboxylate transporter substrate binding protein [Mesorhizobium sp. CAU 1741]|uniref:Bug family tripartite tricarboxylate transporter substrate binding protein n=1 Tax=Mesorhizobium sp. CAU 1741 TaxID=3140366 RepID=UPI00325AD01C